MSIRGPFFLEETFRNGQMSYCLIKYYLPVPFLFFAINFNALVKV